jgi:hypothetical protein
MTDTELIPIDVAGLYIVENPCDLRRDIHVFVRYVREREVKRSHRHNRLSKADAGRLAKLMSDPLGPEGVKQQDRSGWLDYVDKLCLTMGLVTYDTEGEYQGYTSSEPSYPDNYIQYRPDAYGAFLDSSLQDQVQRILDTMVNSYRYDDNEFFPRAPLGTLDAFDYHGCAVGVLPGLDFARARRFLLQLLQGCTSGPWYSTASLIRYLEARHRFFLIPEKPKIKQRDMREGRYGNFHEHRGDRWSNRIKIAEDAPSAFERVEGRFVERFLEGIPLTLGYVEVAYGEPREADVFPSLGRLQAFRIRPQFLRFMRGEIPSPKVTIQPNFEIHVESEAYAARLLDTLTTLADLVTEDTVTILKLQRKKVTARLVQDPGLDVVSLLQGLSHQPLPPNVVSELEEWAGHSEVFTLYTGFGLLEGDAGLPAVDRATAERISPAIHIVSRPRELFEHLEQAELVPLWVRHGERSLQSLSRSASTAFPKVSARPKPKARKVSLRRELRITLHFPSTEILEIFRKGLAQARCAVEVDRSQRTISFPKSCEEHVKDIVKRVKDTYRIRFEDVEGQ